MQMVSIVLMPLKAMCWYFITGLSTREARVGTTSIIDITLDAKSWSNGRSYVTGYGTQKKEVTGAACNG